MLTTIVFAKKRMGTMKTTSAADIITQSFRFFLLNIAKHRAAKAAASITEGINLPIKLNFP